MLTKEEVITEAMKLPEADRMKLVELLFQSMEGPSDADAEHAWAAEIHRRMTQIDRGQATWIPWEQGRRMILEEKDETAAD